MEVRASARAEAEVRERIAKKHVSITEGEAMLEKIRLFIFGFTNKATRKRLLINIEARDKEILDLKEKIRALNCELDLKKLDLNNAEQRLKDQHVRHEKELTEGVLLLGVIKHIHDFINQHPEKERMQNLQHLYMQMGMSAPKYSPGMLQSLSGLGGGVFGK